MRAIDAIHRRDWIALEPMLHPNLHWMRQDGSLLRGRDHVLAALTADPVVHVPWSHELRDGQIYQWVEPAGFPAAS